MNDIRKEESLNALGFKLSVAEVKTAEIEQITQNTNVRLEFQHTDSTVYHIKGGKGNEKTVQ